MSTQAKEKCPLCLETMDLTDKQLKPCKCGYEICLWCWHHIMEMDQKDECGGRCPGCRSTYNKDRILETSISNQILKELLSADKSNLQKERTNFQKQNSTKNQLRVAEEQIDPNTVRVIQKKLVYIVGMPSEFASDKILRQKDFLGQYGKIENIIIDNVGACQQSPDSGRVYVTFSREEEAVQCIESVNGFILDGRPLKATFGVTRYCHVWLSNKVCQKPNCTYVHQKAQAEDICTKDDVAVVCARLQHLLGMDMKGPQQRSGSTLPSPGVCNSRITICNADSKNKICINDSAVLPKAVNKNLGTLHAAISRDSNVFSGNSSSIVNGDLHQQNSHESILNNQQRRSAFQSQELPPLGPKGRLNEQLASSDDKFQASAQLGNGVCDPKRMISPVNGTVDNSWRKPQYANVVSQQSSGPDRRFTVLTRELTSTDTVSKATGQVCSGVSNSKKPTLPKDEHVSIVPRCQNVKVVPQRPYVPPHKSKQLSLATVKSHAGEEEKNACSDISGNPVQGKHMQFSMSTASASSTASQSLSGSTTIVSNPLTSGVVSQMLVEIDKLSDSHRKLASENKSPVLNQQKAAVSNKVVASASDSQSILHNQVVSTDGRHLASARGDQSLYNRKVTLSGDIISSQHVESSWIPRPVSALSSTGIIAKDNNGRKRQVCPPGFKELHHSSDSGKFISISTSTCSALCSTSHAPLQDSCSIADQPDIINWVSECLENDEDTKQSNSASISSALGSTDTIWRSTQLHGSCFGASNHCLLPPYPGGLLQCMGGVQNSMKCCCTFPSVSSTPNQKPEYWNSSANNYMAPGGYDAFFQNTTSGMKTGMVGTLLQQSSPPSLYAESTYGSADASLNSAHVDHSYPMYTLF